MEARTIGVPPYPLGMRRLVALSVVLSALFAVFWIVRPLSEDDVSTKLCGSRSVRLLLPTMSKASWPEVEKCEATGRSPPVVDVERARQQPTPLCSPACHG